MTESLETTFVAIETVKAFWVKDYVQRKFMISHSSYCEHKLRSAVVNAVRAMWYSFTENLCLYGSVAYLGYMGIQGSMSVGEVLMFIYLIKQIIMPLEVIFRWSTMLISDWACWECVEKILSVPIDKTICEKPTQSQSVQNIWAHNVSFAYPGGKNVFERLNIILDVGKVTSICGDSGSGKTTLYKILTGFYHSPTARYLVNDQVVSSFGAISAYACLHHSIFPMTIYENILLGNSSVTEGDVETMFERLGFCNWIESLDNGIHTLINEDLSGGQKQTISTVRAFLSGMPLIILDEPASALDAEKTKKLANVLNEEKRNRIILLTSHRSDESIKTEETICLMGE